MNSQHTINKFTIDLQLTSQQNSYALQRRCVHAIKENIIPKLNEVLSDYFNTAETVLINLIEIDLGTIKADVLEEDFTQKYMAAFSSKIREIKTTSAFTKNDVSITDEATAIIKQFIFFLKTGQMHWASYNINFKTWMQELLSAIRQKENYFKQSLTELIAINEVAAERLIYQFADDFIAVVVDLYSSDCRNKFISLSELLRNTISANYLATIRIYMYKEILFYITGASIKTATHYLPGVQAVLKNSSVALISTDAQNKIITVFSSIFQMNTAEKEIFKINASKPALPPIDNRPVIVQQTKNENTVENDSDTATYIANAGIILLHPYLKTLFTTAGLLNNDAFKDDYCKQKAVHMLQYAVTGQQHLPEYMLVMNKLLCAMPAEAHIDRFTELTKEEQEMVNELLQAVINNWAILGNTSITALQETFLQRKAKLVFNKAAGHWLLQVERTGLDVLLEKIPWGFAYVKLPWMPLALATEW